MCRVDTVFVPNFPKSQSQSTQNGSVKHKDRYVSVRETVPTVTVGSQPLALFIFSYLNSLDRDTFLLHDYYYINQINIQNTILNLSLPVFSDFLSVVPPPTTQTSPKRSGPWNLPGTVTSYSYRIRIIIIDIYLRNL